MSRSIMTSACLSAPPLLGLILALAPAARADDDPPRPPVEVYDWSVWVGNPAAANLNGARAYRNAMPAIVGTSRPKFEGADLAKKFAVAPISVVQAFGEPAKDLDFDLRVKTGTILAHWPRGGERTGRVQWFKSELSAAPPAGLPLGNLPEGHPFQELRRVEPALYLKHENRVERFLAYDAELAVPTPVKIRGGPDEYTLQNLTGHRLLDVAVVAPTDDGGYRVGWLDELPAATPDKSAEESAREEKAKEEAKTKVTPAEKADAVFADAEAAARKDKDKAKDAEAKPLPAEGDATIRARVDQILNRPVQVAVEGAPRREVLALVAGQARLRYEIDEPTLAKAEVDLGGPMTLKSPNIAARDALAEILGAVGLSYRVAEDGTLFVTTAARLAEAGKKGAVIEGPPIKLTLAQPLKPADPSYRELTRDAYARRLAGRGLRAEVVRTLLDGYAGPLFEPDGLIVLAHLTRDAIDEAVLLDVFPPPRKLVRTAAVVLHGVDPRLQDRARALVRGLGDKSPKAREAAESRLLDLGPVAVPVLEDALKDPDVEVVFRAERLLLQFNRPVP